MGRSFRIGSASTARSCLNTFAFTFWFKYASGFSSGLGPGSRNTSICFACFSSQALTFLDMCTEWPSRISSTVRSLASGEPDIGVSNRTVNSTYFSGITIHFPANDCLRISAKPMAEGTCKGHRKMPLNGCFFHCYGRQTRPVVTIADAFQITFIGTQMLGWNEHSAVMQLGTEDAHLPTGITLISHCVFGSKAGNDAAGIHTANVCTDGPCLSAFGNAFGSNNKLAHAVDWGKQQGKTARWAGNTMNTSGEPFLGTPPAPADLSPFAEA